jgi:hypothetical protein
VLTYAPRGVRAVAPYIGHVCCYVFAAAAAARLAYPGGAHGHADSRSADAEADAGVSAEAPPPQPSFTEVLRAVATVVRTTPGAPVRLLTDKDAPAGGATSPSTASTG